MESIVDRFIRYARIDTQSSEDSPTYPTTAKQLDLSRLLVDELNAMRAAEVDLSEHGVVTATLPSTLPPEQTEAVPVVGFIAHVDTSPAVSGRDVKPQIVDYAGGDVALPGDPEVVIKARENPELARFVGEKIITSDGTTLLGADDKAGVAAIMHAAQTLLADASILHGKIRLAFTPDEETGRGTEYFDVEAFGAKLAYTVDGSVLGEVENETFCADLATITCKGRNQHPGYAKGIMINSQRVAADFIAALPRDRAPETTEKRQGYLHPDSSTGNVEQTAIKCLIRSFDLSELTELATVLQKIREQVLQKHPGAEINIDIKEQYRNMRLGLDRVPRVTEAALEAVRRIGVEPHLELIRGGTDGARLTELGLPTPNIFTGGINFHAKTEWLAVPALQASSRCVIELAKLWAERPELS